MAQAFLKQKKKKKKNKQIKMAQLFLKKKKKKKGPHLMPRFLNWWKTDF